MAIDLKNYEPALMQGADIGVSVADVTIDDLVCDQITASGAVALSSTLAVTGNLSVNTNKFTVAAASGNTVVAGTLDVTGASTLGGAVNFKRQVTTTGGAFATPIALTVAQSGRVIMLDTAAGLDFTLPAIAAGDIGTHYLFVVSTTVTSNSYRMTAQTGDIMTGAVWLADFDTANTGAYFTADGVNDLICTLNGGTTGGKMGSWLEFTATTATQWFVRGVLFGDGTLATPFS